MNESLKLLHRQLSQAVNCFFAWDEDGEWVHWDNEHGPPVVHHRELAAIIRRLKPIGLPSISSICLLSAAMRQRWPDGRHFLRVFHANPEDIDGGSILAATLRKDWQRADAADDAIEHLDRIHDFPRELLDDLDTRCELAAMVFENCEVRAVNSEDMDLFVQMFDDGLAVDFLDLDSCHFGIGGGFSTILRGFEAEVRNSLKLGSQADANQIALPQPSPDFVNDANGIATALAQMLPGLRGVTADALRRRMASGLEQLPAPTEEIDLREQARSLIHSLADDLEFGGMARLAADLLGVVHFPRSLSEPEALPLGGVSDITNRGNPDQLLLSELAYDELTLAVRVSMNEALYLRRESPPRPRSRCRRVFLDSGLCMWGVPRVFATSIAMALTATSDKDTVVQCFRADGEDVVTVDLATREGLEQHIEVIHPQLDGRNALPALARSVEDDDASEFVLITSYDVASDQEFRAVVDEAFSGPVFIITVARDGRMEILRRTKGGQQIVRTAVLNLNCLLERPPQKSLIDNTTDLPAFFACDEVPLLLSHPRLMGMWFEAAAGTVAFSNDGRVMLWTDREHGARQIATAAPRGSLWHVAQFPDQSTVAAVGTLSRHGLVLVRVPGTDDPEYCRADIVPLKIQSDVKEAIHSVYIFAGYAYVILQRNVHAYDVVSGSFIASQPIPFGLKYQNRRFFARGENLYAVHFDGQELRFFKIPGLTNDMQPFDCAAGGIAAFHSGSGTILRTWDERIMPVTIHASGLPDRIGWVSPTGDQIILRAEDHSRHFRINVESSHQLGYGRDLHDVLPGLSRIYERTPRIRFSAIYFESDGCPVLIANRKTYLRFHNTANGLRFEKVPRPYHGSAEMGRAVDFGEPEAHTSGCRLRRAEWSDGSRAWIDSRGLLHLRSANSDVPEVTLTTAEGRVAGWMMGHGTFGDAYYLPNDHEDISTDHACEAGIAAFGANLI